ncbi:MAG: hypothetical protein IJ875_05375 [Solobacterium sp.]|nr:hypothetical protein [Solobacterium sp.]
MNNVVGRIYPIVMYVVMLFLLFRIWKTAQMNKKNRVVIDAVKLIDIKDDFFTYIDTQLEQLQEPIYIEKLKVLKFWGKAYHDEMDNFIELMNSIDMTKLVVLKKNGVSINEHEDSFFYMLLSIPNILYGKGRVEERHQLEKYMDEMKEVLDHQLSFDIAKNAKKYYDEVEDKGQVFFEKVMEGDYGEYVYNKSMISIYKNICNALLHKLYLATDNPKQEETKEMISSFNQSGVGNRFLKNLNLVIEENNEEENSEEVVEETQVEKEEAKEE